MTHACRVWQVATNGQPGSAFRAMPSTWSRQLALVVSLLAFAGCLHWMVPWQVALAAVAQPFLVAGTKGPGASGSAPAQSVPAPVPLPQASSGGLPTTIHMAHPILM